MGQELRKGDVLILLQELKIGLGIVLPEDGRFVVVGTPDFNEAGVYGYFLECDYVLGTISMSTEKIDKCFTKERKNVV